VELIIKSWCDWYYVVERHVTHNMKKSKSFL